MAWNGTINRGTARGNNDHLAEHCRDDLCRRLPCEMFKAGYRKGYDDGYQDGYAAGYGAGYAAGYSAGYSAGAASSSGTS
jgi:hypothetical protein